MARIVLNVELNNQKVPAGIKQIREQIASLGDAFGKIQNSKDVTDGVKALTAHYQSLINAAKQVSKAEQDIALKEEKVRTQRAKTIGELQKATDAHKLSVEKLRTAEAKTIEEEVKAEQQKTKLTAATVKLLETEKRLEGQLDDTAEEIEDVAEETVNWTEKLKEAQEQIDKVFGNAAIRLWRTWFSEVKNILGDVNDVLTKTENTVIELQRVLNDTVSDRQISNALYDLAQKYGQTFENASTIAQNFAKSGMSWNDTIKATESALLAMNVAELNASESSEGLLSIMVQFKKDASELETIVDQLNKTADKNPVTTEKLLKALQRTGSAAATSNLTLEKTIGIITTLSAATNRSGQNIGTATNALIMYTQKNLDIFAQMSEESAKVVDNFKRGTADIVDIWKAAQDEINKLKNDKDKFNSMIDLFGGTEGMEELNSSLHDELEDTFEQINSVYNIANTYRKNYFIALLDNLDRLDKVQDQLQDAQGYSQEENLKYMSTLEAKMNTLTSKWEYLANDEQGLLKFRKGLVDLGIQALDLVKDMGGIANVVMTITGLIGGLVVTIKSATIAKKVMEAAEAFKAMGAAVRGVATAGEEAQASFGWIGLIIAALSVAIGTFNAISSSIERTRQKFIDEALASRETTKEIIGHCKELKTLDEKSDEYYEVEDKIVSLLGDKSEVLDSVTQKTKEYSETVKQLTKDELEHQMVVQRSAVAGAESNLTKKVAFAQFSAPEFILTLREVTGWLEWGADADDILKAWDAFTKKLNEADEAARQAAKDYGYYSEEYEKAVEKFTKLQASYDDIAPYIENVQTLRQGFEDLVGAIEGSSDALEFTQEEIDGFRESVINSIPFLKDFVDAIKQLSGNGETGKDIEIPTLDELAESMAKLNEVIDETQKGISALEAAQKEVDENGEISIDTFQSIVALGHDYVDVLEIQNGKLVINKEKLDALLKSKDSYLNDLVNEEVLAYAQIRADELLAEAQNKVAESAANAAVGIASMGDASNEALGQASNTASKYVTLAEKISQIAQNKGLPSDYTGQLFNDVYSYEAKLRAALKTSNWLSPNDTTTTTTPTGTQKDEELERIKATISLRKSELTLMEHQGKSTDDQISKMREIQASLHDQVVHMTKVNKEADKEIYSLTDINALSSEWWSYQEKILKLYQDTLNTAKELELEAIEDLISSIQEQIDLEKEELSIAEKREAVAKAELDYTNAIKEARKEYVLGVLSDYLTALSDAQTLEEKRRAVTEAREKYATAQKEAQTKAVIDAMKAQKDLGNDALSLEEKRLAVEEARQALIDAENDRTTRVFDEATGEWHYEANAQNVKSAQEKLADAMKSLDDYLEGEAWDELLEKMENGSLTEGEMASILNKWASEGYGSSEWVDKIREAYRTAIGTKADPDSLTGELNAINSAVDNLNTYLKNQAIKELQQYIKDGNTSTEGMQQIMNKWLSMGEGGEIWSWSNGVVSKVSEAIQSGKYDDSKVQSSINNVVSAINGLKTAIENSYISKLNKLLTSGTAEEMLALIAAAKASGEVNQGVLDPYEELQRLKAQKEEIEKRYEEASKAYNENNLNNAMAIVDGNGNVAVVASTNASGLDSTTAKLVNDVVENVGAKFDAALAKQSMGIMVGASDKTPSVTPIYNSSSSNMSDSHDTTINGVPIPVGMADKYTLSEMVDILSILG